MSSNHPPSPSFLEKAAIRAQAWSDCGQCKVEFDAILWAEQASDKALIELGQCGCRGDYPADDVAMFMADCNKEVARLFDFIQIVRRQPFSGDTNGFECAVNEDDLRQWLQRHKPHLVEQVFCES